MWVGSALSEPRDRERGRDTRVTVKEAKGMDGGQVVTNRFSSAWTKGNANSPLIYVTIMFSTKDLGDEQRRWCLKIKMSFKAWEEKMTKSTLMRLQGIFFST